MKPNYQNRKEDYKLCNRIICPQCSVPLTLTSVCEHVKSGLVTRIHFNLVDPEKDKKIRDDINLIFKDSEE